MCDLKVLGGFKLSTGGAVLSRGRLAPDYSTFCAHMTTIHATCGRTIRHSCLGLPMFSVRYNANPTPRSAVPVNFLKSIG